MVAETNKITRGAKDQAMHTIGRWVEGAPSEVSSGLNVQVALSGGIPNSDNLAETATGKKKVQATHITTQKVGAALCKPPPGWIERG